MLLISNAVYGQRQQFPVENQLKLFISTTDEAEI